MRLHRSFVALLLGLPMAAPSAVVAEDASLAPEVQRRVAVVVLARRIRGYAAMAKATWAFISTPVPTATPTAARSAVWA